MRIEKIKIKELVSPEYNPRQITDEEMEKLKNSITEFGYVDPIIVNDVNNHIVGGNQRYEAIKSLGYDEIDVVYIHEDDINKEKALNIALNRISGDFHADKLKVVLEDIQTSDIDIELTGLDEFEVGFYLDEDIELFPFDYEEEEEEMPEDYMDVEGERTNEQFVISISFTTQERANEFLEFLNAPYKMTKRTVGIHDDEITWGE